MKNLFIICLSVIVNICCFGQKSTLPFIDEKDESVSFKKSTLEDTLIVKNFMTNNNFDTFICKEVSNLNKHLNLSNLEIILWQHNDLSWKDVELSMSNDLIRIRILLDNTEIIPADYNEKLLPKLLDELIIKSIMIVYEEKYHFYTIKN